MLPPLNHGDKAFTSCFGNQESRAGEGRPARLLQSVEGGRVPGHGQQEHEVNISERILFQKHENSHFEIDYLVDILFLQIF
jgi:hypothetical protein